MSKSFLYPGAYRHFPPSELFSAEEVVPYETLPPACATGCTAGWSDESTFAVLRTDEVQEKLTREEEDAG